MSIARLIIMVALCALVACKRTPSQGTLAGEWRQDIDYRQSQGVINQLLEIFEFEDYELYITDGHLAASRLIGKEPDEKRVYWESPFSLTVDSAGNHQMTFDSHTGQPMTGTVSFGDQHLILKVGKRQMGFLKNPATNLRIKGYAP